MGHHHERFRLEDGLHTAKKTFMQVHSGLDIDPFDPDPALLNISDIAHSLSKICRFNGHTLKFYSVAEHCIHVERLMPKNASRADRIKALLHDAGEAYLCDIPRPIKMRPEFKFVEDAELIIRGLLLTKYGLTVDMPAIIWSNDNQMLAVEAKQLMRDPKGWNLPKIPEQWSNGQLPCWDHGTAFNHFMDRFVELMVK